MVKGKFGDKKIIDYKYIKKFIVPNGVNEKNIHTCLQNSYNMNILIRYYNEMLSNSGIPVPKLLEIKFDYNDSYLIQEYIEGDSLNDFLNNAATRSYEYLYYAAYYFSLIIGYISDQYNVDSLFRIDTNLENFIIDKNGSMILVDIYPPINVPIFNKVEFKNQDLKDLYLNIDIQIIGLIGYFFKPLVKNKINEKIVYKKLYLSIQKILEDSIFNYLLTSNYNYSIFGKKISVIENYINNDNLDFENFQNEFLKFSITRFLE
ncbi:hypothetical protein [Solibacillus sp. NPDC093137]|uniref:hypothetical protein n=1 Tax=Solibacillus sp. NPDC093137 TaxID=3390678 RepID=UPI003D077FA3